MSEADASEGGRRCPACGAGAGLARGEKNGFRLDLCPGCGTLYARRLSGGCDYDAYYHEANLSVPAFVGQRLDEILAGFAPHRRLNRLLDVGCGAGSLL